MFFKVKMNLAHIYLQIKHIVADIGTPYILHVGGYGGSQGLQLQDL